MTRILAIALVGLVVGTAHAGSIHDRMTLVEAIEAVRSEGHDISYSTRLVEEWMLVRETPDDDDSLEALAAALAVYGLELVAGAGDQWLVVKSSQAARSAPPASPGEAATPSPRVVEEPRPLEEITIVASRHSLYSRIPADQFLSGEEIRLMPHMADDAFRAFHRLPGVAASDYQAPFNLRGGTVDEVQVLLNGIELVEPYHMRTLFNPLSVIDPGIIGEAQIYSGGFTARQGNYTSGVIDIATRVPRDEPVHELGVSFVSAFARSGGGFADGRGSYFVSLRRGYLDLLAEEVVDDDEKLEPRYGDLYASLEYTLNDRLDISASTLLAEDDVRFVDPSDGEDFGEDSTLRHFWLAAGFEPGSGVRGTTALFAGQARVDEFGSQSNLPTESILRFFYQELDTVGLQTDWVLPLGDEHVLELGARFRDHTVDFDYRLDSVRRSDFINNGAPFNVTRNIRFANSGSDLGAYVSYRNRIANRFIWELGLRWDRQDYVGDADDSQVSPRFNLSYAINDRAELRLAWGNFYQPQAIQELAVPDGDTTYYDPERAEHRIVGLRYEFDAGIELQVDAYDKRYRDLKPRYENVLDVYEYAPESNFDRTRFDPISGRAYGAELTVRNRGESNIDWWFNYTWSKAQDTIDDLTVPRSWDQRNAVTGNVVWRGERWSISVVARYHSGWPRTPLLVDPVIDANDVIVGVDADLTRRNTSNYDDYSRVDFRLSRFVPLSRGSFEYYVEVFNVFNQKNQCCASNHLLTIGPSISVSPEIDDYLPLFPSFGFVWRFGPGAAVNN